ncbi:MAG: YncE family protein [Pyrinomonadaceae bacterium]
MKSLKLLIFVMVATVGMSSISQAQKVKSPAPASGYHLVDTIKVGGDGGWDILTADSEGHRLYVSHSTKVEVIDTAKDKVVGEILNTNGVHGIAVARKYGRGFTSNGRDDSVTVFDLKTLKTIGTVKVGKNPDCIIYDPFSARILAFNRGGSSVTAINAADSTVAGTLDLPGHPEFAESDEAGKIFVNLDDKSEVISFDAKTLRLGTPWPVAPGEDPSGLAIDRKNHRLFMVCGNKMLIVMDSDTGKVLADFPTGDGTDGAVFDPKTRFAFSSNGEGTLTIVREEAKDKFSFAENITTQRGARTIALDNKTHRVYLPTAQFGPPPPPTADRPNPRPTILPNTFVILVYGR